MAIYGCDQTRSAVTGLLDDGIDDTFVCDAAAIDTIVQWLDPGKFGLIATVHRCNVID